MVRDFSKHTFKSNRKGLVWLLFMTIPAVFIIALWLYLIVMPDIWDSIGMKILCIIVWSASLFYELSMLYSDWASYLFAVHTTLEIDMQTYLFTYRHKGKTFIFKPADVAHWYMDIGFRFSRVAAHHTVIILQSGEQLFVPMWLFEGNRFLMTNDPPDNTFNAGYFILSIKDTVRFPQPEAGPRYKYILPPEP